MKRFFLTFAALALAVTFAGNAAALIPASEISVMNTKAGLWDGTGYVWEYKLTMDESVDQGISHWTLELCAGWFEPGGTSPIDLTFFDEDGGSYWWEPTDPPYIGTFGDLYEVETGADPTLGITGIKYNAEQVDGEIKTAGQMEYFAFRLDEMFKPVEQAMWGTKNGQDQYLGSVLAPGCEECPDEEIPEPATLLLLGGGLAAGAVARRRRKNRN